MPRRGLSPTMRGDLVNDCGTGVCCWARDGDRRPALRGLRAGVCRRLRGTSHGRQTCVMEGAMILSFWMIAFMLLPLVGLGTFAFLMNREEHHHR